MAMKNPWPKGNPFNWRGARDTPVTPHYRHREPGSLGENQKFPADFLEIFGPEPFNRRMFRDGASITEIAKAHIDYTTAWRDYIGVVDDSAFAPFAEEFGTRFYDARAILGEHMDESHALIYRTWTGSAKKVSVYKVAFPNAPIFNTTMLTPVPFHASLAKLLGTDDDEEHRRNAALDVVAEYQKLLVMSGEYVENLIRKLASTHIGTLNAQLGRDKAEREAAEKEARRTATEEATKAAGEPASLNELLGWTG